MEAKELTRKELYDLVWSKPISTLSKQFHVKSSYLKEQCTKFNIPTPKSGYWTKIKHGKDVEKTELNGDEDLIIKLETINDKLDKKRVIVPAKLSKPHKLVAIAKKDLANNKLSYGYASKGMITTSRGILNITVTPKLVSRALIFMDLFVKLAEERGFKIWFKEYYGTVVSLHGIDSPIYLREKNKRIIVRNNGLWNETELEPIGELAFKRDDYPRKEWHDSKSVRLEAKIPSIIDYFEEQAIKERAEKIEREKWREEQKRKQKIEDDLKELRNSEIEKFNLLYEDSTRYYKAEQLRGFINAKKEYASKTSSMSQSLKSWIDWANEKADWLDPLVKREDTILGDYESFK